MKIEYRKEIDGLRAIAVLSVIFYHLKINFVNFNDRFGRNSAKIIIWHSHHERTADTNTIPALGDKTSIVINFEILFWLPGA